MNGKICAICGIGKADTSDHIPPKCIFPKPRPSDLVTVPSCFSCNNSSSKEDEEFRVFLSMQIGMETQATHDLWRSGALRSILYNERLKVHIINNHQEVEVVSPNGDSMGKRIAVKIPARAHDAVLGRIVRGLYFHHFGEILGERVSVLVHVLSSIPREEEVLINRMNRGTIGGGALKYIYSRASDSPLDSIWFLFFYDRYLAYVETCSKA